MQTNVIRIVAAVVDTSHLTLYKENGETVLIPQGDPRVRRIVDTATSMLIQQGYAEVDIATVEEADNTYVEFEEVSNGVVKLFRIAKSKIAALFSGLAEEVPQTTSVAPMVIGSLPTTVQPILSAVEEIMQHAVSVTSPEFTEEGIAKQGDIVEQSGQASKSTADSTEPDTIIAVIDGKIIPGMEKVKSQFGRAAKLGSTIGVENFLKRLGSIIDKRGHSVEDLLKFMERGDLPIADDGSILIYKVLYHKGNSTDGKYVDCHTRKVEQWVGAYVCMDPTLVDHDRRNECSNGLHVARRGYVSRFSGSVCVLAKLAPEDVIAVPSYDADKMRVCGYHIIAELSQAQHNLVKQNQPITNIPEGKVLLGKALAGQHIGKTHEVRITQNKGGGVQVTELKTTKVEKTKVVAPVAEALINPSAVTVDTPIDPKSVVQKVEQLSRKDKAVKLYAAGEVEALKAFKKASKVSWDKLGVPDPDVTPPIVNVFTALKELPTRDLIAEINEGSPKERIQKLLSIGLTSVGVAQAIRDLKKKSKKSWETLGVTAEQAERIVSLV